METAVCGVIFDSTDTFITQLFAESRKNYRKYFRDRQNLSTGRGSEESPIPSQAERRGTPLLELPLREREAGSEVFKLSYDSQSKLLRYLIQRQNLGNIFGRELANCFVDPGPADVLLLLQEAPLSSCALWSSN